MRGGFKEIVFVCLLIILYSMSNAARLLGEVKRVEALLGGRAEMPCDVSSKDNDSLLLLVWYKGSKPFYSYDGRLQKHWRSKEFPDSSRVLFTFHREPAALLMDRVILNDQATYRCRADFAASPTRNSGVYLVVIILPSRPFFMDEIGTKVEKSVGPLHEGDTLLIVCLAVGGQPPPKLSWWKDSMLLDTTDEPSEVPGIRENQLLLLLTRDYFGATIQCQASNNNLTVPLSSSLLIDMYVSPETVTIMSSKQAYSAGHHYEIPCYINGSHPLPEVSWWLDGKIISDQEIVTEVMRDEIISTLHFTPQTEHNGQDISCVATNIVMAPTQGSKLYSMRLNVFFKPIISISLVTNKHGNDTIQEGEVIQFRCMVEANPWITNTEWFANDRKIQGSKFNNSEINLSSSDLIIVNASILHTGNYYCKAYNIEGSGESNMINLKIQYKPKCIQKLTLITHKIASFACPVDAHPKAVKFYWKIENKKEIHLNENILISDRNVMNIDNIEKILEANYVDEVLISCWASNKVGEQKIPCRLRLKHIFVAPSKPQDCRLNATTNAIIILCTKGTNNSNDEMFGSSVWQYMNGTKVLINNVTTPLSNMMINDLKEGQTYEVLIYAFNKWGESESVQLIANTTTIPRIIEAAQPDIGLWCGVALGLTIMLIILVIVLIIKKKHRSVISNGIHSDKTHISNGRIDKPNYISSSNADITAKPLLYKNGKTITKGVLSRNNSEPKIIEDFKAVQNIEDVGQKPPAISRKNKPKLPKLSTKTGNDENTPIRKRSFETSRHRKEINKSNGSIQMSDKNPTTDSLNRTLQVISMSKESIV